MTGLHGIFNRFLTGTGNKPIPPVRYKNIRIITQDGL